MGLILMSDDDVARESNGRFQKGNTGIWLGKKMPPLKRKKRVYEKVKQFHVPQYSLAEFRVLGDEIRERVEKEKLHEKYKSGIHTSDGNDTTQTEEQS